MQMGQANGCSVSSSSSSWSCCLAVGLVRLVGLDGWLAVLVESVEDRLRLDRRERLGEEEDDDCVEEGTAAAAAVLGVTDMEDKGLREAAVVVPELLVDGTNPDRNRRPVGAATEEAVVVMVVGGGAGSCGSLEGISRGRGVRRVALGEEEED